MNLDFIEHCLKEASWKNQHLGAFAGWGFDLFSSYSFGFIPWKAAIKVIPILDVFMLFPDEVQDLLDQASMTFQVGNLHEEPALMVCATAAFKYHLDIHSERKMHTCIAW
jgi:hypothetical protein